MSTVLTNGIIIPDNGSRNWGGDLANNWNIIDLNVGYMTDVKNRVTTLENSVAENSSNIQINTSNISALQTSKQDVIEDLETIRAGASAGATAVQPNALNNYVDLSSEQTIIGAKTFSSRIVGSIDQAEKDINGNIITSTYATKAELANKANDSNVVHKSGDETVSGIKTFTDRIFLKSSRIARGSLPASDVIEDREFELIDKNNKRIFSIFNYYFANGNGKSVMYAYNPNTTNYNRIGISFDFNNINSQKSFAPNINNDYNLGTPALKWKDVYAITFHGDVDFPITEAQIAAIVV